MSGVRISEVESPKETADIRAMFEEYAAELNIDLSFQDFAGELAGLPGDYARPRGRLLMATVDGEPAGCVGLRPLDEKDCEMKRLFVRPAFRKLGVARLLVETLITEARSIGYSTMKLDTLPVLTAAIRLYESQGFVRCAAYYETPLSETVFMERFL